VPPGGVNFSVLLTRFRKICSTRTTSAKMDGSSASTARAICFVCASLRSASVIRSMMGRHFTGERLSVSFPVCSRERSSRSSMICACAWTVRRMVSAARDSRGETCTSGERPISSALSMMRRGEAHEQLAG